MNSDDGALRNAFKIPHDHPPRFLQVITAYVDESGQEQDNEFMFVAGYMGDEDQWRMAADSWKKAIFPRQHLHLNKLRFARESEREMLQRAGNVPKQCGLTPILGGIRQRDYRGEVFGTQEERVLNGYVMCCYAMVVNALRVVPDNERLEVVFERQDRYWMYLDAALFALSQSKHPELLMEDGRTKLAGWRSINKGDTVLTELADYFSYALRQLWRDKNSKKSLWCNPILDSHAYHGAGAIWTREQLKEVVDDKPLHDMLPQHVRELLNLAKNTMGDVAFGYFTQSIKEYLKKL